MQTFSLVLKNGTIATPAGIFKADIGVIDGKIAAIASSIPTTNAGKVIDCTGLHVLPGVIDSQVHFREPGNEHKEDLESGSRAAVMGGVTTVFEMPNTNPLTTSEEMLNDKLKRAKNRMWCEHAFFVGGTAENYKDLPELERLPGVPGIKVFMGSSTGNLLVEDDENLLNILKNIKRRASFHSEDEPRLRERINLRIEGDASSHPVWRDVECAMKSTRRLVEAARKAGNKRIHVLHISTAAEMDYLQHHKDIATVEILQHHLTLEMEAYSRLGTYAQMNPPIRGGEHLIRAWQAVNEGLVDVLGSDHAPHTRDEKNKTYPNTPSGMTGVQTLVPMMLNHVNNGKLSLERFVDLTAHGPQRIFGMANKGRIAVGYDADFTIVDMKAKREIKDEWIQSKAGWTPYNGQIVQGWVIGTLIRGNTVMWNDELQGTAIGQPAKFVECC